MILLVISLWIMIFLVALPAVNLALENRLENQLHPYKYGWWLVSELGDSNPLGYLSPPTPPPLPPPPKKKERKKKKKGVIGCPFAVRKSASGYEFWSNQLCCSSIFKWAQKSNSKRDVSGAFTWCHRYSASWWSKFACCSCSPTWSSCKNSSQGGQGGDHEVYN